MREGKKGWLFENNVKKLFEEKKISEDIALSFLRGR